jgi:hypothetical protein
MNPSEKFLRFAAECEAMAKLARTRESKNTWRGLAARWIRYAELVERELYRLSPVSSGRKLSKSAS